MIPSLLVRFQRQPIQTTFLCCVLIIHILFLLVILISPNFSIRKKEHKQLIVKTVLPRSAIQTIPSEKKSARAVPAVKKTTVQSPPQQKKQPATAPEPKKQEPAATETPKPKTNPLQQKKEPLPVRKQTKEHAPASKKEPAIADKRISSSKPIAQQKKPPVQNRAKISDSLLQELEDSIAKIENKSDKAAVSKTTPTHKKTLAPIALQIDSASSDEASLEEGNYTAALVNHLHQALSLPDYGEVKIQLSLRQDGTVAKVVVLKTQSEKNRQYLENNLPRLRFPRFEGTYANKKESTFVLTFCNEL